MLSAVAAREPLPKKSSQRFGAGALGLDNEPCVAGTSSLERRCTSRIWVNDERRRATLRVGETHQRHLAHPFTHSRSLVAPKRGPTTSSPSRAPVRGSHQRTSPPASRCMTMGLIFASITSNS